MEEFGWDFGGRLFDRSRRVKGDRLPVVELFGVAIGVNADFAEHSFVELEIGLHLNFAKYNGATIVRRNENTINAKTGFLYFDRFKSIACGVWWRCWEKVKQQSRRLLKDAVKDGIALHTIDRLEF